MDSFAQHPVSLAEARAERAEHGGADIWSPRDVLISVLRRIDSGEIAPDEIAVIITIVNGDGTTSMDYAQRCHSTLSLLGLYQTAIGDTLQRGYRD